MLQSLRRALPEESFLYLGDTARVPYGSKPLPMVRGFAREVHAELLERGVKGVVVACNTASAAALPALAAESPVPVWGVVEPGVAAASRAANGGIVGVLGTVATIGARVYQDRLEANGLTTWSRACPLFVPLVEEGLAGDSDTAIAVLVAEHYLADRPPLDAVILGCTHYPALKPVLRQVLGPDVPLIDSADEVARVVAQDLREAGIAASGGGPSSVTYLVTGDPAQFRHSAGILGVAGATAQHLDVSQLVARGAGRSVVVPGAPRRRGEGEA